MALKDMKIRLPAEGDVEEVGKALAELGYENVVGDSRFKDATELYVYSTGNILKTTKYTGVGNYFKDHRNEEHFLFNGQFVTKDYFKQPETPSKQYCKGCNVLTCGGCSDASGEATVDKVHAPLPLKPRAEHNHERMIALAKAILEHVTEGRRKVPVEWIEEFAQLNTEMENT